MLQACWKISTFWFPGKKDIITRWEYCYRDNDIVLSSKGIFIYADNLYLFVYFYLFILFIYLFIYLFQIYLFAYLCKIATMNVI